MATLCPTCGVELPSSTNTCPRCSGTSAGAPDTNTAPDPSAGRIVGGRYRLLRRLGQGGMGVVYVAEHVGAGQKVAIKFLHAAFSTDPEIASRFQNEARSYAQIVHPHAVQLHDFGQDEEGNLYITMEYLEGCDLKRTLAREGRLKPREALDIALQVADVLGTAHARGIVHRDLKPENIMLSRELRGYHVKVLDFGLAHLADSATRLTAPGMLCGTPRYMAPEQAEGLEIDQRVDIYALGLVLFESLTGRHPFESPSVSETLRKQRIDPVPPLAQVAPDIATDPINAVIQRATAKDRERRFGSMLELARELAAAMPGTTTEEWTDADTGATVARAPSQPAGSTVQPNKSIGVLVGSEPSCSATHFSTPRPAEAKDPRAAADQPAENTALHVTHGAGQPASTEVVGAAARRSRRPIMLVAAGVAVAIALAAAGAFLIPGRTGEVRTESPPRSLLDGFYRANGEPLPPSTCREGSENLIARLVAAAPHLKDSVPDASRALEAATALSALEGLDGSSAEAAFFVAKARSLAGKPAGPALAVAVACRGFATAENLAGNLALKDGRLDEAEQHYAAAMLAAPGFTKAQFNRAVLKFQQGRVDEAIGLLETVIAQQPGHADAHYALALIRERKAAAARSAGDAALGESEAAAARDAYCKALELGNQKAAGGCVK